MIPEATLKGYLLEEALAWMLRGSGYRLLVHESQDPEELCMAGNGLCVRGRGADHQVDVLGEFAFTPAFSLPVRLFLEAKFTRQACRLPVVRNAHGVIHDINENFTHGPGHRLRNGTGMYMHCSRPENLPKVRRTSPWPSRSLS